MAILVRASGTRTHSIVRSLRIGVEANPRTDCWLVIFGNGAFQRGSSGANYDLESPARRSFFYLQSVGEDIVRAKPHRLRVPTLLGSPDQNRVAALLNASDFESAVFPYIASIAPRFAFTDREQPNKNPVFSDRTGTRNRNPAGEVHASTQCKRQGVDVVISHFQLLPRAARLVALHALVSSEHVTTGRYAFQSEVSLRIGGGRALRAGKLGFCL